MQFEPSEIEEYRKNVEDDHMKLLTDTVNISQIPAPTFEEELRAEKMAERFREIGVDNVYIDPEGNVVAHKKNRDVPAVCVTAHLDTVFESTVNHTVQVDDQNITGPGVGDDSLGLATLLSLCRLLPDNEPGNLVFVATTSTEMQGNLRGSRYFVDNCREDIGFAICLEGHGLGRIDHWSLGTVRLHIEAKSQGGHVWRDETGENPIEVMSGMINRLDDVKKNMVDEGNFGIINAGIIRGGRAFNTVPYGCGLDLEIRSDDTKTLNRLCEKVFGVVREIDSASSVELKVREVSRRPVSGISVDHWLVETVSELHRQLDIVSDLGPASSDGCIFLSNGIPAVTLGLARGHHRHREDESVEIDSLSAGQLQTLLSVIGGQKRQIEKINRE